MQAVSFYIQIKPISYNQSHVVVGNVLRSSSANTRFKNEASKLITPHMGQIKKYCMDYTAEKSIEIHYIFWVPEKELYTKQGNISKRSLDIDNCVKSVNDVLFKRMSRHNSDIDDSKITRMTLEKRKAPNDLYGITISLL